MLEPGGGLANKPIKDLQVFGEGGCLRFLGSLRWGEGGGGGHIQARQDNLPACHPYDRRPLPRRQAQSTTTPHPLPFLILQVEMVISSTSVRPRRPPHFCKSSWVVADKATIPPPPPYDTAGGDGDFFHISEAKKTTLQDIMVYGLLNPKERCDQQQQQQGRATATGTTPETLRGCCWRTHLFLSSIMFMACTCAASHESSQAFRQ